MSGTLKFTDDYLIGIEHIDGQHRHLFELIEETDRKIKEGKDLRAVAEHMVTELREYAKEHFADEEKYMESIKDPELPKQIVEHKAFVEKINAVNLSDIPDEQIPVAVQGLLKYASKWLMHHILGMDTLIGKGSAVSPFEFTEKYLTGIKMVDDEHAKLFQIMSHINDLIHNDHNLYDLYDEIVGTINELRDYTREHFNDEETYMGQVGYEGLEAQQAAHDSFVKKLDEINLDDVDDNQEAYLADLLGFLLNWLSSHILNMDKKIPVRK